MTINDRVRLVRKSDKVHLTMESFGDRLGVKKAAISKIENGNNSVSETIIKSICREFGVSEIWLRDGEGEMFQEKSKSEQLMRLFQDVDVDDGFKSRFVAMLAEFDPDDWKALESVVESIMEKYQKEDAESFPDPSVEDLEEQYKKEVLGSAADMDSSASSIIGGA